MTTYSTDMDRRDYLIHPQKFGLWIFIATVVMAFAGFTSAYIVQRGSLTEEQLLIFEFPPVLWRNLAVILMSSITLQYAIWAGNRGQRLNTLLAWGMTFLLGTFFLIGQWDAFMALTDSGLPFVDETRIDNSVSYFYIVAGLHGFHIVAALIMVFVVGVMTARDRWDDRRRKVTYEMSAIFWHFLGLLWIYLFFFLYLTQN